MLGLDSVELRIADLEWGGCVGAGSHHLDLLTATESTLRPDRVRLKIGDSGAGRMLFIDRPRDPQALQSLYECGEVAVRS